MSLRLKDHVFTPAQVHVKAGTATTVTLASDDADTEEFDSDSLKIEKIVHGHTTGMMRLAAAGAGALSLPWASAIRGTAQGVVIAE